MNSANTKQEFSITIPNLVNKMPDLRQIHPEEAARWLFLDRFISMGQLSEILEIGIDAFDIEKILQELEIFITNILSIPRVASLIQRNAAYPLQMLFSSNVLLFRSNFLTDEKKAYKPCSIVNLRGRFPTYFYPLRNSPNWYENEFFYIDDVCTPRWALVGANSLNCTFQHPKQAKYIFCKRKKLPINSVKMKSITEEIYDRIIIQESLEEEFFDTNCNALTSTFYNKHSGTIHQLNITQKKSKIGIHRNNKFSRIKMNRPYWTGFFPSIEY